MATSYTSEEIDQKRKEYRAELMIRLFPDHGDASEISRWGITSPATVVRWKREDYKLPDAIELKLVAEKRGQSLPWLAFNIGPKEPSTLNLALEFSAELEKDPALKTLLDGYKKAHPSARKLISELATELSATVAAPEHVETPSDEQSRSLLQLDPQSELKDLQRRAILLAPRLLAEDPMQPILQALGIGSTEKAALPTPSILPKIPDDPRVLPSIDSKPSSRSKPVRNTLLKS